MKLPGNIIELRTKFVDAKPFPHLVLHDVFPEHLLHELDEAFADPQRKWQEYENNKQASMSVWDLGWFREMARGKMTHWLEQVTGIFPLMVDPTLRGGGLHRVGRGGKLGIHVDFNCHPNLPMERALNTLLYLNHGWNNEWMGDLELWDERNGCVVKIPPKRGTFVMFEYSKRAWHGHPHELKCPDHRRSAAFYYYSPLIGSVPFHTTVYRNA